MHIIHYHLFQRSSTRRHLVSAFRNLPFFNSTYLSTLFISFYKPSSHLSQSVTHVSVGFDYRTCFTERFAAISTFKEYPVKSIQHPHTLSIHASHLIKKKFPSNASTQLLQVFACCKHTSTPATRFIHELKSKYLRSLSLIFILSKRGSSLSL